MLSEDLKKFSVAELIKLAKIPSISFDGFDHSYLEKSGEAVAELLRKVGFQNVELARIDNCFPYVLGDYIVDPKLPTLLLYAHHDVQPPGREELWKSPPFEPVERNGRLYGRGTADDKAGILVHAAALHYFTSSKSKPPVNLKVIIEGEEEIGSNHLFKFLDQNKKRLQSHIIIVTDTGNIKSGVPSMTTSLRGMVCVSIEVKSMKAPLHSGIWGGVVVDPVQVLVKMLSKLTSDDGTLLLESTKGRTQVKRDYSTVPLSRDEVIEQAGVLKKDSVPANFLQENWDAPSYSINAIQASSEKLANNVICDRAFARIGIRITKAQKAKEVLDELTKKLKASAPSTVEVNLKCEEPVDAWETDPHSEKNKWAFEPAEKALEKAFGTKAVYMGCGASIPFIGPFEEALKSPVITLGVEDPYTLAHSENESLYLDDFYKAIDAEIEYFKMLGTSGKRAG